MRTGVKQSGYCIETKLVTVFGITLEEEAQTQPNLRHHTQLLSKMWIQRLLQLAKSLPSQVLPELCEIQLAVADETCAVGFWEMYPNGELGQHDSPLVGFQSTIYRHYPSSGMYVGTPASNSGYILHSCRAVWGSSI